MRIGRPPLSQHDIETRLAMRALIRKTLARRNLTQNDLAAVLGLSKQAVSQGLAHTWGVNKFGEVAEALGFEWRVETRVSVTSRTGETMCEAVVAHGSDGALR